MTIVVIDCGAGNLTSLGNALASVGNSPTITRTKSDIQEASHLILPGVGSFAAAMRKLRTYDLLEPIRQKALDGTPLLGICLGMQLFGTLGYEGGKTRGLNLLPGEVVPLEGAAGYPIPHIGWTQVEICVGHPVFGGPDAVGDYYFNHECQFHPEDKNSILAYSTYGTSFCSVVAYNNIIGTQFHPEKSQDLGLGILSRFCSWNLAS